MERKLEMHILKEHGVGKMHMGNKRKYGNISLEKTILIFIYVNMIALKDSKIIKDNIEPQ